MLNSSRDTLILIVYHEGIYRVKTYITTWIEEDETWVVIKGFFWNPVSFRHKGSYILLQLQVWSFWPPNFSLLFWDQGATLSLSKSRKKSSNDGNSTLLSYVITHQWSLLIFWRVFLCPRENLKWTSCMYK